MPDADQLKTYLARNSNPTRPSLLVLVDDPDQDELVVVWWRIDRPNRLRCSVDGTAGPPGRSAPTSRRRPMLVDNLLGDAAKLLTFAPPPPPKLALKPKAKA